MKKTALATAIVSLLSHAYTSPVFAQNTTTETDETMVVLARSENVNSISEIPSNVVVISREEIEKSGAISLSSLLRGRAGIQVSDSNSGPAFSIRGFSGEQAANNTLILLDGRRLNSQDLAAPNLSAIQIEDIESIEVLSGSAGVLYGDQAVGGVINIITRDDNSPRTSIGVMYGSYSTKSLNANTSGKVSDEVSYYFSAMQKNSDNYRDHNKSEDGSIRGRVNYENGDHKLYIELGYYDTEREFAGSLTKEEFESDPSKVSSSSVDDFGHEVTKVIRLGYDFQLSESWVLKNEVIMDDVSGHGVMFGSDTENDGGQLSYLGQLEGKFNVSNGYSNYILGVDASNNDYSYISPYVERENDQQVVSIYTQYQHPILENLVLTIGGRYSQVEDSIKDIVLYSEAQKMKENATAYELGLNYQISDNTRLYARTASNFRFAKVSEQAGTAPGVIGLKPQTGISNEIGWSWNQDIYTVKIDAFNLALEDEIVYVGFFPTGSNQNADASVRNGVSIASDIFATDSLNLFAEYTYINAEFSEGVNKGKQVGWVASNSGKLGLNYYLSESFDIYLDGIYTGEMYQDGDNSNDLDKISAYWLVNMALNYNIQDLKLSFRAENLLNEKYASYVFYDGYYSGNERSYYLNASYQF